MLIEQLPSMPELMQDLQTWRPTSYRDYFGNSPLPGRHSALEVYDQLDSAFRAAFDTGIGTGSLVVGAVVNRFGFRPAWVLAAVLASFSIPYYLWAEKRFLSRS